MITHDPFRLVGCRACDGAELLPVLNLGTSPLANVYLRLDQLGQHEQEWPLEVGMCQACGCVQLYHAVDPGLLFDDYLYTTGDSGTLRAHYEAYAKTTAAQLNLTPGKDLIVGIGGNDGTLELAYQKLGHRVLNIEPSKRVAALSAKKGVPTLIDWFTEEAVHDRDLADTANLITCNNAFAHIPDIREVIRGVKAMLKPRGWFVVESADLEATLRGNHFDQFYHEHVFYWHRAAFERLMAAFHMTLEVWEQHDVQGGSFRAFVRNEPPKTPTAWLDKQALVTQFAHLQEYVMRWQEETHATLNEVFRSERKVACYGWPAKATLLSKLLDFKYRNILYAVDDMPSKQGLCTPGSHILIVSREHFLTRPPDVCLLTASNYADDIIKANSQFKGQWIRLL